MSGTHDGFFPHSYFHVGLIVADMEAAQRQLTGALGLAFNEPHLSMYGGDTILVAYARQGPPYVELVRGEPGSRWSTSSGSHMDHVGYFSTDLDADIATLQANGLPLAIDGREYGARFAYHDAPHLGARIELIDAARRERILGALDT